MTAAPSPRDLWIAQKLEESARGVAAMHEEARRIIANSRPSIRPLLQRTYDECQLDHDEERQFGWAVGNEKPE